jgi:hypothetical protein
MMNPPVDNFTDLHTVASPPWRALDAGSAAGFGTYPWRSTEVAA